MTQADPAQDRAAGSPETALTMAEAVNQLDVLDEAVFDLKSALKATIDPAERTHGNHRLRRLRNRRAALRLQLGVSDAGYCRLFIVVAREKLGREAYRAIAHEVVARLKRTIRRPGPPLG